MNYLMKRRAELAKELEEAKETLEYLDTYHISGYLLKGHFEHLISENLYIIGQIDKHLCKSTVQAA